MLANRLLKKVKKSSIVYYYTYNVELKYLRALVQTFFKRKGKILTISNSKEEEDLSLKLIS